MSAGGVKSKVDYNDSTMANTLPSTQEMKRYDMCNGIHGAMRWRKGIKRGTSAARRRRDKEVINQGIEDFSNE